MKTEEEKKYFIINMLELCYNFFKNDSFTENQLKTQIDVLTDGLDKTLNTLNFEEAKKMIIKKLAGGNGEVQFFNPSKLFTVIPGSDELIPSKIILISFPLKLLLFNFSIILVLYDPIFSTIFIKFSLFIYRLHFCILYIYSLLFFISF